jgi:hypothetical protein
MKMRSRWVGHAVSTAGREMLKGVLLENRKEINALNTETNTGGL